MERHSEKISVALSVGMVADHQRKIAGQLSIALAMKQIHQAMIVLGDKDRYPWPSIAQSKHPVHSKFVRHRTESSVEIAQVQTKAAQVPFDARQVVPLFAGLMLLEVQNIAVVPVHEFGNGSVQALPVEALHQQDRGVLHGLS